MASLSSMFSDWKSDQNDNFESFPDWYVENYDQLRGKLRIVQITSNNMYLESSMRNSINMKWYWSAGMEPVKVTFEAMHKDDGKNKFLKEKITEWLKTLGYKKTMPDGKDTKLAINCADINAVLAVFAEFNK